MSEQADRRDERPGRRAHDVDPEVMEDLGKLAAAAGARVSALEDIGDDLATLTHAVEALAESIGLMATKEEVEAVEKRQNRKRALLGAAGVVFIVVLSLPVIYTRAALDEIQESGDYLVECTTPSPAPEDAIDEDDLVHECYEEGQARQATAVQTLNLSMLDAVFCARSVPIEETETCFLDRLEARATTPPADPDN